ncbi:MAG: hypothetical protein AAB774_01770 [Patescibacteria group bacterium]
MCKIHHVHPFRSRLELAALAVDAIAYEPARGEALAVLQECREITARGCTSERIRQCCELVRDHHDYLLTALTADSNRLMTLQLALLLRECVFGTNVTH